MEEKTVEETVEISKELNSSKESEGENVDAIKRFIEDQEREISDPKSSVQKVAETVENVLNESENVLKEPVKVLEEPKNILKEPENILQEPENDLKDPENVFKEPENVRKEPEPCDRETEVKVSNDDVEKTEQRKEVDETLSVASSVMDMILSESEAKIAEKSNERALARECVNAGDKGNSMALSVGSKVEAKDYGEFWYRAQIIEVDYEEMEVLVHYDDVSKKLDEWISVSSPRLRPIGSADSATPNPEPTPQSESTSESTVTEPKTEEKKKVAFAVDERCLARWRDNRRFVATISQDFGDGKYEIIFDDGVRWTCNTSRLYKMKDSSKSLSIDMTSLPASSSTPSPVYGPGPSSGVPTSLPLPAYHTHLFDPTRDYLGSKSERREMKRKLNIKEIFNIGQKKKKVEVTPKEKITKVVKEKKPKVVKKKIKLETEDVKVKTEVKKEIPDAVASIIGTVAKESLKQEVNIEKEEVVSMDVKEEIKMDVDDSLELDNSETLSAPESQDLKHEDEPVAEEEAKLENFEKTDDVKHEQVIVRIKEVITKLEDGLNDVDNKDIIDPTKLEINEEIITVDPTKVVSDETEEQEKPKKSLTKIKKGKKLRLLQEKKVKKQVEKVKSELEEMKKQVAEMRKQMLMKTEELAKGKLNPEMPESFLLPGEWCCKWVNGQPVGTVSELEAEVKVDSNSKPALPRRSVQVEDKRLPEGWTKHMVRRSVGSSAGKWDVVLVSPDNRRFHTKTDMRNYLENNPNEALKPYEQALMDFGVHLKLSRRMGWYTTTPGAEPVVVPIPADTLASTSPLVKRKKLTLKKSKLKEKTKKKLRLKLKVPKEFQYRNMRTASNSTPGVSGESTQPLDAPVETGPPLEDGYVYVGSLKVQIIENLLRCPADNCFKNFRNNTLLKMHIKHYHRELKKMLGATPKVLDLAYARTRPTQIEMRRLKFEAENKTVRIKLPRLPKRYTDPKPNLESKDITGELHIETPTTPVKGDGEKLPKTQDSPKLRNALTNKPVKRPKVLLPVRRPELNEAAESEDIEVSLPVQPIADIPNLESLDFETAISTHTVTKPIQDGKRKGEKKRKSFATISKKAVSEDEEWFSMNNNSDVETRSSYPRSGTPDSKTMDQKLVSSESNEEQKLMDSNAYLYTDSGERIKIVHMKREEIINCHCGFREEDGLMVQCELCLCWQHALCHNIQRESEVPEKYTCSICLNPRRGRRSQRFLHDQDRLYEGLLPGAKPCESLRRSHELSGNLLRIEDALHALRVKYYVATKKDHPKLYLWAKDWETAEITMTQEKLNSDYSDLNIMISNIGKENLPVKPEEMNLSMNIGTPPSEEQERFSHREGLGSQALLSGLLSSPGGASLDLPISTSELERLAKTVQEQDLNRTGVIAPQPEAAIENSACRERLLKHIQRCQALIDARLDSIEAQVAELESQDPSFEDDETADYCPRTKQTIQMLMRDLDTMEELGVIT